MYFRFEFEGRRFELAAEDGSRVWLFVDGNVKSTVEVLSSKPASKADEKSWDEIIAERERELRRCLECGRAKKKQIRDMEDTIYFFKQHRDGEIDYDFP